jgi:hypothetical protein
MDTATALTLAIEFLDLAHGGDNDDVNQVITRLGEMLKQKGCEHFDRGVKKICRRCDGIGEVDRVTCRECMGTGSVGSLPDLVDIIIDG